MHQIKISNKHFELKKQTTAKHHVMSHHNKCNRVHA